MAVIDDRSVQSSALALAVGEGTAPAVDVAALAAPVPGERPCGELLRYDGTYGRLENARRADDSSLPQGVWQTDLKTADWEAVAEEAAAVLASRSKDAQIAVWLTEALAHRHGFSGVAAGLETLAVLCETFWDGLHPAIDPDGDADARCAPFVWLDAKLTLVVERLPLARPGEGPAFGLADMAAAQRNERMGRPKSGERPPRVLPVTTERIGAARSLTPTVHLVACRAAAQTALVHLRRIDAVVDAALGRDAPGLTKLRNALAEAVHFAARELQHRGDPVDAPVSAELPAPEPPINAPVNVVTTAAAGAISSREQAYRQLADAAHYLMETEPHSPVPYLVLRAVRWRDMKLGELLVELVRGDSELRALYDLLGMSEAPGG
ncbi:MAG: type VI secretion system protein TssA [Rhodospirillaceae bacterium]